MDILVFQLNDQHSRFWFKLTKNRQKIVQKCYYFLQWIHHDKKFDEYENIYSANPLYLTIRKVDEFIEQKIGSKYLAFDSTDENKKHWQNTQNFRMRLKVRQQVVVKPVNIVKISWKLKLTQIMIYHWIS